MNELKTVEGHKANSRGTYKGHPIHFINKDLWKVKDNKRTVGGQLKDSIVDTTSNPNPKSNLIYISEFEKLWQKYPRKDGRKKALMHFTASVKTENDLVNIRRALNNYIYYLNKNNIEYRFIKSGSTWFNNWQDWIEYEGTNNELSIKTKRQIEKNIDAKLNEGHSDEQILSLYDGKHKEYAESILKNDLPF
jgi:hypothetical protein